MSERAHELLAKLVGLPRDEPGPALGQSLAEIIRSLGFEPRVDEFGNVSAEAGQGEPARRPAGEPRLLFISYQGSGSVGDAALWTASPSGELKGEVFYGRGACHTAGSAAAALLAASSVAGKVEAGSLTLAFTGLGSNMFAKEQQDAVAPFVRSLKADFAVAAKPTALRIANRQLGRARFVVRFRGQSLRGGFVSGGPALESMFEFVALLRQRQASRGDQKGAGGVTVRAVRGCDTPDIEPSNCALVVERALEFEGEEDAARKETQNLFAVVAERNPLFEAELVAPYLAFPSTLVSETEPAVRKLASACREVLGHCYFERQVFSGPEGWLRESGIPVVAFGPGDPATARLPDEHVSLQDIDKAAAILEKFAIAFLSRAADAP
jgi:acetylornithine deacetylase/succinyl-diaminopimelate desuccinylase-like protein